MKKIKINFIIISLSFLILSCADFLSYTDSFMEPPLPPFIITRPIIELEGNSIDFNYAGISFSFQNKSVKSVSSITTSFMLFDAKTQSNPFIGSNIFEIKRLTSISPGESKEIVLSLDKFIHIAPSEPYLIDFFYISEIEYTDGSVWRDRFGTYRIE
jgi:hypothetical protein